MQEVSTQLVRLDVKSILTNYRDPQFWQKRWKIFSCDTITMSFSISTIDTRQNLIRASIQFDTGRLKIPHRRIKYTIDSSWEGEAYMAIPINNPEYTQTNFENKLLGTCIASLESLERMIILYTSQYKAAEKNLDTARNNLNDIANEFLDDNDVINEDIREAYVEKYTNKNIGDYDRRNEVIKELQYTILSKYYLLLISYFDGSKDKYDEYAKKCKIADKKLIYSLWNDGKYIASDKFVTSMKDYLESITETEEK